MELAMLKTSKKDLVFFDLFSVVMNDTCEAAKKLEELFLNYTDLEEKIKEIEVLEHKCDKTVHDLLEHLNRSFITPLDREDIFLIAKMMDDIIDFIESTAHRLKLFNITVIRPESHEMTRLIIKCTNELRNVIEELKRLKYSKTLHARIVEVNQIENEGDDAYRKLIQDLFTIEKDPIEIIKWKEIFEFMEKTLDACEDVANIIEGIVSKNA
jgi:predicted phosphate transport protein (TIGR00153 family)